MRIRWWRGALVVLLCIGVGARAVSALGPPGRDGNRFDRELRDAAIRMLNEGRQTFRFDTFGSEAFWGDQLRLHEAIRNVPPATALAVGLKVDMDALPMRVVQDLRRGRVDLDDPAVTAFLLQQNAVVGVTGFFDGEELTSIGIQCALCHSTVDDALAPGVGRRLDGWANRDLNVGAIVALAPNLQPFVDVLNAPLPPDDPNRVDEDDVRAVLESWGPGKFDAELILDGQAFRPAELGGGSAATLLPPAFGLAGVNLHTWTGWGSVTHWNAFVGNLEMHGQGTFYDPRLADEERFPVAAANGFDDVRSDPDRITGKLAALHFYQLAIPAPEPPAGSFDPEAAQRGQALFEGQAECARCHVPPLFTEPGWNMHTPEEIGIDSFQADRSPDGRYRTSPLAGLWTHMDGGFFHDGRFATLEEVVEHYSEFFELGLTPEEIADLVEYLKSL